MLIAECSSLYRALFGVMAPIDTVCLGFVCIDRLKCVSAPSTISNNRRYFTRRTNVVSYELIVGMEKSSTV